jgi:transposase
MTMQPKDNTAIPAETVRVARAAFPKGNAYLKLRDELETIYQDALFADLFPQVGQIAESPGRLALVTVLQFAEGLTDRQAADAVRSRIDWKYILGLELSDPGFDYSILSEFRGRLIAGKAEERLLDQLLKVLKEHGLLKERSRQRTDSTHIWAAIRRINRLEKVGETLRAALNDLATMAPEWLKVRIPASWYARYATRMEESRLPKGQKEQDELAVQIGKDGRQLLQWVYERGTLREIQENGAVEILRRVWIQEYYQEGDEISWRGPDNTPPGEQRIHSPYDAEARYSEKRGEGWVGYKGHLTETCEEDRPHIIVQVETTPAPQPDFEVIPTIQQDLAHKQVLPEEHLMDQGYMNIRQVVAAARDYGIRILGHPMGDSSWQAKEAKGFDLPHFAIDWDQQVVHCPLQHASRYWRVGKDSQGQPVFKVEFSAQDCGACPQRAHCTHSQSTGRRLSIRPQAEYEALQKLRQEVQTEAFKATYRKRAGIEGTISQAVRAYDFRRARYIGLAKVHLQQIASAAAINLARVFAWLSDVPLAKTRISPLSSLALATP